MRTAANTSPRSRPNRVAAFTMNEVMVCVVILAIASAVVLPMVGNRSDLKLAAGMRKLVADLQYAQNLAVASRDPVYVRFEANQYTLFRRAGSLSQAIDHPIDPGTFVVRFGTNATAGTLASLAMAQPNFGSSLHVIGFDSVGSPVLLDELSSTKTSLAAAAAVILTCEGDSKTLKVEPYTGEITVP